jgi:catechol 2,3-dioxygenase-like lactoylglutathione lyase family enzyme
MKRPIWLLPFTLLSLPLLAQDQPKRPRITGIDHVRIYVTDINKSSQFYTKLIGVRHRGGMCSGASRPCFTVGWGQHQTIELAKVPAIDTKNWLAELAFATDDIEQMQNYLVARGVTASRISKHISPYDRQPYDAHFEVRDPEGTPISFIQSFAFPIDDPPPGAPWYVRIIHAGLIVHDRIASDHFYKDILGFRPYWHGGRKDDGDDWVSLQVPDGTDWVEYMLNISPDADHHTLGVMNHIALGVKDIHATQQQLIKNGWTGSEQPKIGRDGKWQLNLYDPDDTRVELMEFTPTQKPCCSEYTGPHPGQHP